MKNIDPVNALVWTGIAVWCVIGTGLLLVGLATVASAIL